MVNQEFQNLKHLWSISKDPKKMEEYILLKMRNNLKGRNGGNSEYVKFYTSKGRHFNIDDCEVSNLFEIDGDMNPRGM